MIGQSLTDLWYGFSVALQPHNLMWSFFGVLIGNLIGVLPGMGALSAIAMLLPLTYTMHAVPAILMLAGIFYGSQYGGAIGAILLNMPSHPPHAVTCLDGYPMTKMGKGGTALGITMIASFFAASFGITVMIFASPLLVEVAFKFGPTEIFSIMLLGLLAGATMARGSPLKGVAMTVVGLLIGVVGTDVNSGALRFTFGLTELSDKVELVALAIGPVRRCRLSAQRESDSLCRQRGQSALARHAPEHGRAQAGILPDGARHAGRHTVRCHARHRPHDHNLHRLRAGAKNLQDAGTIRPRARWKA